jgi:hypothetical protein
VHFSIAKTFKLVLRSGASFRPPKVQHKGFGGSIHKTSYDFLTIAPKEVAAQRFIVQAPQKCFENNFLSLFQIVF